MLTFNDTNKRPGCDLHLTLYHQEERRTELICFWANCFFNRCRATSLLWLVVELCVFVSLPSVLGEPDSGRWIQTVWRWIDGFCLRTSDCPPSPRSSFLSPPSPPPYRLLLPSLPLSHLSAPQLWPDRTNVLLTDEVWDSDVLLLSDAQICCPHVSCSSSDRPDVVQVSSAAASLSSSGLGLSLVWLTPAGPTWRTCFNIDTEPEHLNTEPEHTGPDLKVSEALWRREELQVHMITPTHTNIIIIKAALRCVMYLRPSWRRFRLPFKILLNMTADFIRGGEQNCLVFEDRRGRST